jgi:hypothetical protein
MTYPTSNGPDRSTRNALIVAGVGAAATIGAAVIAAIIGLAGHGSGASANPAAASPTARATSQQAGLPKAGQSNASAPATARTAPNAAASPSFSALPTQVPVLKPTEDPGFSLVWHGTFTVTATGVHITSSGVFSATPRDWDIAYQADGGNPGWQSNMNNSNAGVTFGFDGTGTPGPSWCQGVYASTSDLPGSSIANVGDRECYVDNTGIVGYLQVTSVGPDGPKVVAWFWKGPPPSS